MMEMKKDQMQMTRDFLTLWRNLKPVDQETIVLFLFTMAGYNDRQGIIDLAAEAASKEVE